MMRFIVCLVIFLSALQIFGDQASATSGSSASFDYGIACAESYTDTAASGQGNADAEGSASYIKRYCQVSAQTDSYAIIYNYCGAQVADAFSAAFGGGFYPIVEVHTWASNNGYYCSIFSSADALACVLC
eukprot:TRINITY_DN2827_c0_g2_i1.p3 TRINITY_DN2827_c0_g2~~TRINITY_DN2827_c0_g2_i1.p3  ORF type:complete len:130 (-),score=8.30 TRINITY_DN2827_c0_g2_i1:518-907(-)